MSRSVLVLFEKAIRLGDQLSDVTPLERAENGHEDGECGFAEFRG